MDVFTFYKSMLTLTFVMQMQTLKQLSPPSKMRIYFIKQNFFLPSNLSILHPQSTKV